MPECERFAVCSDTPRTSRRIDGEFREPCGVASSLRGIAETDYRQVRRDAQRVAQRLRAGREVRITASNGTDLTLRLKGRPPWIDDGIVDRTDLRAGRNIATAPPGAVVVAIDERSAQGTAIASRPSYLSEGRADGGQWEVQGGPPIAGTGTLMARMPSKRNSAARRAGVRSSPSFLSG